MSYIIGFGQMVDLGTNLLALQLKTVVVSNVVAQSHPIQVVAIR